MIHHYEGTNPTQCQVYKWGKGATSCPNQSGDFGSHVSSALSGGGMGNVGIVSVGAISYTSVQGEINVNRLVMVRWSWDSNPSATGHMIVIRGYNTTGSTVSYVNPLNAVYTTATYSATVNDSAHLWTHSRYQILG